VMAMAAMEMILSFVMVKKLEALEMINGPGSSGW